MLLPLPLPLSLPLPLPLALTLTLTLTLTRCRSRAARIRHLRSTRTTKRALPSTRRTKLIVTRRTTKVTATRTKMALTTIRVAVAPLTRTRMRAPALMGAANRAAALPTVWPRTRRVRRAGRRLSGGGSSESTLARSGRPRRNGQAKRLSLVCLEFASDQMSALFFVKRCLPWGWLYKGVTAAPAFNCHVIKFASARCEISHNVRVYLEPGTLQSSPCPARDNSPRGVDDHDATAPDAGCQPLPRAAGRRDFSENDPNQGQQQARPCRAGARMPSCVVPFGPHTLH